MGFSVTEILYQLKTTTARHNNKAIAKDPWVVHKVWCPVHGHELNTNVWTFSNYKTVGMAKTATLTLSPLNHSDDLDSDLYELFQRGDVQITITVQFPDKRTNDLRVDLKP